MPARDPVAGPVRPGRKAADRAVGFRAFLTSFHPLGRFQDGNRGNPSVQSGNPETKLGSGRAEVSRAGSARPKRSWVLANLVGGGVIIIGLSIALLGIPGSGDPAADSALKPHPAKTVRRAACTQFEQMVNECAAPATTTTTTTAKPPPGWSSSDPVGQGGG